jgi:transcriptional regulator with XRE-family HTH domain
MIVDTFAANLRAARKARGMTQTELAGAAQIAAGYVSMLENAQRDPPLSTLDALARALGTTAVSLLTDREGRS